MNDLERMMPELTREEYRERIRQATLYQCLPTSHFMVMLDPLIERLRQWLGDRLIALGIRLKSGRTRQEYI